jgi:hypothetical protein
MLTDNLIRRNIYYRADIVVCYTSDLTIVTTVILILISEYSNEVPGSHILEQQGLSRTSRTVLVICVYQN